MAIEHGTLSIPEPSTSAIEASTLSDLDRAMQTLSDNRQAWIDVSPADRIELLAEIRGNVAAVADRWVGAACEAKGIERGTAAEGEEWQAGPWLVMRCLRLFERSMHDLADGSKPKLPGKVKQSRKRPARVRVFPTDIWDRLLFTRFHATVYMSDDLSAEDVITRQASAYDRAQLATCVILGAGNVSSIAPTDTISKLFGDLQTVMLKVNPVNEYVGPLIDEAFAPLVVLGVLRIAYGGVAVGAHLTSHPLADTLHMTGSDKTHDAIVFGTGDAGAKNKARGHEINTKPMTSELGSVTPVIVVPGPWRDRDFAYQGMHLASQLTNNAGFNCIASRVIIQHADWEGRPRLLRSLRESLSQVRSRKAYYPGAEDRYERFVGEHPEAERIGLSEEGRLPWTLIADVDPSKPNDLCFSTEAFASIVAEVGLEASDPAEFIDRAVAFANDTVWGSLGVTILVHPRSNLRTRRAAKRAVRNLRYGTVAVNQWSGLGFALMSTPWGGYPGAEATNIGSGRGFVHNTYLLDGVTKTVVRGPWRVRPKPPWFPDNRSALHTLRALTRFDAKPSLWRFLRMAMHSMRG